MSYLKENTDSLPKKNIQIKVASPNLEINETQTEKEKIEQTDDDPLEGTKVDQDDDLATLSLAEYQLTRDRQRRQITLQTKFGDNDFVSLLTYQYEIENEPNSYDDIINGKDLAT